MGFGRSARQALVVFVMATATSMALSACEGETTCRRVTTMNAQLSIDPTGQPCKASGFTELEVGMSFSEVVRIVGQPTRDVGSGVYILMYDIVSGGSVVLEFGPDLTRLRRIVGRYRTASGKEIHVSKPAPG